LTPKTFDAVKLMRDLRDQLSRDMERMTPEERVRYIRERAESTDLARRLAEAEGDAVRRKDGR
jgi:GAF domain-containing protein